MRQPQGSWGPRGPSAERKQGKGPEPRATVFLPPGCGWDWAGCVCESVLRQGDPPPAPHQNNGPTSRPVSVASRGLTNSFVFIVLLCFLFQKLWNVLDGVGSRLKRGGDARPLWELAPSVGGNLRVTHRFLRGERQGTKGKRTQDPGTSRVYSASLCAHRSGRNTGVTAEGLRGRPQAEALAT